VTKYLLVNGREVTAVGIIDIGTSCVCVCAFIFAYIYIYIYIQRRSQWLRGLRHEPSSPARTLGLWVRIRFRAWMSLYVYSVCVVLCVGSGLATF
jgi:hypothetical protein